MRQVRVFLVSLCAGFALAGCAGLLDNQCAKAEDVLWSGYDDYCKDKTSTCLFCDCWNQNKLYLVGDKGCMNIPTQTGTPANQCTGEALAVADNCLKDEASCRATGTGLAKSQCEDSMK